MNKFALSAAAVGLLAFLTPAMAQEKSGVAAAVNPNAVTTPPGQVTRTLLVGADVIFKERIATQADGQVQLIFLDESSLTVGPGSDVTIDEFVYDPKAKTGKMSVRMAGGLVRFVGGRISKNGDVTIATPVNVIGIRGGMGFIEATPTEVTATNLFGTLSVKGQSGAEQVVSRPGFAVTTLPGQSPGSPVKVDAAQLARLSKSMEAPPQAAARNASGAIEGKLDSSQVSDKNSQQAPDSISPDASNQRALAAKNPSSIDPGLIRQAVQQAVTSATQNSLTDSAGALTGEILLQFNRVASFLKNGRIDSSTNILRFTLADGGVSSLPLPPRGVAQFTGVEQFSTSAYQAPDGKYFFFNTTTPISNGFGQVTFAGGQAVKPSGYLVSGSALRAYAFVSDNSSSLKFIGANIGSYTNKSETPLIVRTVETGSIGTNTPARTVALYAGLGIDGVGATQRSGIVVSTGQIFTSTLGQPAAVGTVRGTFNDGGSGPVVSRFSATYGSVADSTGNSFYGATRPDYFTITQNGYDAFGAPSNDVGSLNRTPVGANTNVSSSVQYAYAIAPSAIDLAKEPAANAPRTAQTMNGYVGGIVGLGQQSNSATLQLVTLNNDPRSVTVTTDPSTNRMVAQVRVDTALTAAGNTFNTTSARTAVGEFVRFEFNFGGITGTHRSRSAFINDALYAATDQRLTSESTSGSFYANGSQSNLNPALKPVGGPSADPTQPGGNANDQIYLVSSGSVPISGLMPSGTSFCECSFMSWGWWGGFAGFDDPGNVSRVARINLANYVVGVLPSISQIPTAGSAVYTGHAIGTVRDGATQYIAAGAFQKNWDFASRSGTMTIRGFDGGTYQATSTQVSNPGQFAYSGTGTRGALSVNGSFFASPTDPVKGVGGQFQIGSTSSTYRASGVVVGQR